MVKHSFRACAFLFLLVFFYTDSTRGQTDQSLDFQRKSLEATRISDESLITLDGLLNETVWQNASIATGFIQNRPSDGIAASQRTEAKILYTDKYIFVAFRAYDTAPDSIIAPLFRRDGNEVSDWVYVKFDSYNDKRTAFGFAVNPIGVQKDIFYYDDEGEDIRWDAVWESKTNIDELGWNAELKIPLSQLRFTSSFEIQNWNVNFQRRVARNEEVSFWSRTPREEFGTVSWFGTLLGVNNLTKPLRLEITPYASISDTRAPRPEVVAGIPENPFYKRNDLNPKVGGDFKYGISTDFTLTGTINPDFGQVEADPATINLTAFEIFFEERRPFFLEGSDIFNFGGTATENTFRTHQNFYSRRIGRSPVGSLGRAGIVANYEDRTNETTIAGAAKVSGKTSKGLSIGFLDAYTLSERANYFRSSDGTTGSYAVEPATNFLVSRISKDMKGGEARIGGFMTAVNRNFSGSYLQEFLHESAYQIGLDGTYSWSDRNWRTSGSLVLSQVKGSQNAISLTQQSSARFYDRVDSEKLSLDPTKNSLNGYSAEFSIGKYNGQGIRYSFTYTEVSPGFEVNDIGFQERADYRSPHYYAEYLNLDSDMFRYYLLYAYGGHAWNFDGDMILNFYAGGGIFQFKNFWVLSYVGGFTGTFYNDRIARGGPVMRRPKDWNSYIQLTSNQSKDFYASVGGRYRRDAAGEFSTTLFTTLTYRPTGYLQLSISPTYMNEFQTDQYQGTGDFTGDAEVDYLFSNGDYDILTTDFRLNWTFTPKLSLQTYIRPLIYSAKFSDFKTFEERRTFNFNSLGETDASDFDYRTLQGNAVLRWEYRPGSTFFLVWQQEKEQFLGAQSNFDPFNNAVDLLKTKPINVFLVKLSFWFGT